MKRIVVEGIVGSSCGLPAKHFNNHYHLTTLFTEITELLASHGFTILPSGKIKDVGAFDIAIFTSRHWMEDARKLKSENPDKMVIVFVGIIKNGDDAGGVIPLCCSGTDVNEQLLAAITKA